MPIKHLLPSDLLYSRSEGTGADAPRRVLRVTKRSVPLVLAITLADTRTGKPLQTLTTTREHPFFVQGKGFVPAGGLAVGNAIVTRAGPPLVVQQVRWRRQVGGFVVYNVVVEDSHTYFVGSHNGGLWVYNPDCSFQQLRAEHGREAESEFRDWLESQDIELKPKANASVGGPDAEWTTNGKNPGWNFAELKPHTPEQIQRGTAQIMERFEQGHNAPGALYTWQGEPGSFIFRGPSIMYPQPGLGL